MKKCEGLLESDAVLPAQPFQGSGIEELVARTATKGGEFVAMALKPALKGSGTDTCHVGNLAFVVTLHFGKVLRVNFYSFICYKGTQNYRILKVLQRH